MLALAGADSRRAEGIVARLRDDIAAEGLTVSAGIAEYPRHALDKAELMRLADGAMYWAKKRGRDRQFVYSPGQDVALSAEEDAAIARRDGLVNTVHALARSVDTKDGYTHLHSRRVADYAAMLAERLGVPEERVNMIRTAGVLHDVGKIGVPDAILLKPGRLTPEEFSEMKRHSRLGQEIIAGAGMAEIADWVCHLHERFDGHGYPDGLAGEAIPLESRILAVTDALEEITSPRVYRQRRSVDEALIELELSAGSPFDPRVVTELVRLVADGELVVDPPEAAGPASAAVATGT